MGHKVLCLHGLGTNGDIMEAQIAPLRYYLGPFQNWDFEFVDGEYAWPIANLSLQCWGAPYTGLSYYDGTPPSALSAIDSLAAHLSKVRSVVFLSGTLPVDRQQLMKGHMGWIKPDEVGQNGVWNLMDIPSVHAWSPRDASNAGESQCLREIAMRCQAHGSAVASLGLSIGTMLAQIDS
ncbi:hypothetical protein F4808DRAFT_446698 [Astrocystis sublimbata]|nr:hypothetical protein F4808DRAFT_446698 [Astrocystis sublimbata]